MVMVWVRKGDFWKKSINSTLVRAFPVLLAQFSSGHGRTEDDPLELGDVPLALHNFETSATSFIILQDVHKEEDRRKLIHDMYGGYDDAQMIKQIAMLRDLGLEDIATLVNQEMVSQHLLGLRRDEYRWNLSVTQKRMKLKRDARMQEREMGVIEQPEGMRVIEQPIGVIEQPEGMRVIEQHMGVIEQPVGVRVSEQDKEGRDIIGEGSSEVKNVKDKSFKKKVKKERQKAKKKLVAAIQRLGRYIHVYKTSADASSDLSDALQELCLTVEECQGVHAKKDKTLKTLKHREEEQAAPRSMYTKSTIKVRFPDNFTLEATFHPSDTIQSLIDLLKQVVSEPERPFYIYTTTPEKQLIDMSQDFYSAGFIPGAIVYFSYDVPKGEDSSSITGPFLNEEILSFKDVVLTSEEKLAVATKEPPYSATSPPSVHK